MNVNIHNEFIREEFILIPSGHNLTSVMSDSHADHEDDQDGIGVLQGPATLGSDTETDDRDEEKNNVDNEDDEENEITAPSSPRDFPVVVENEVVVADNDEDVNININNMGININVSRIGDMEIEDNAVEIVSETVTTTSLAAPASASGVIAVTSISPNSGLVIQSTSSTGGSPGLSLYRTTRVSYV